MSAAASRALTRGIFATQHSIRVSKLAGWVSGTRSYHLLSAVTGGNQRCRSRPQNFVSTRRWATSTTPYSTSADPAEVEANKVLAEGTQKLEDGDLQGAKDLYKRSVEIKRQPSSLFNLGVAHYHLREYDEAIEAWKESIALQPDSADAHTNLASAYIISPAPRPDLALHHLQVATSLCPEDPEIAFNLAAVLEACGRLEEALEHYKRSKEYGVERAAMHIRNASTPAKILGQRIQAEEQAGSKPDEGSS
ncbi:TPR-like protein [Obba rivulosa]|uniref:TPR-like protein n=1 Tax=Obba rivulosa TaxID=1052685 RepID=A0A8E2DL79_9APHY|nr:TPR-like protein [Obba rivulosa]